VLPLEAVNKKRLRKILPSTKLTSDDARNNLIQGESMQIELSKDEYRSLLDLLVIAEWVLNVHNEDPEPTNKRYHEVEQKIFSYAGKMGFVEIIEYDIKYNEFFPTADLEEGESRDYLDEYDNNTFWTELVDRLIERDVIKEIGEKKLEKLTIEKRYEKEQPLADKYGTEFEKNGLDNLVLKTV